MRKAKVIVCLLLCNVVLHSKAQNVKIRYEFGECVTWTLATLIKENPEYFDSAQYCWGILLRSCSTEYKCTLMLYSRRTMEGKRSLAPLFENSNREVDLGIYGRLPIIFESDIEFSQWPTGINGSFFSVRFKLPDSVISATFD